MTTCSVPSSQIGSFRIPCFPTLEATTRSNSTLSKRHWNQAESRWVTKWIRKACAEYIFNGACAGEDVDSACRAFELLRETVNRNQGIRHDFDESQLRERMCDSMPLGGHHLGTTGMAATAREEVVDITSVLFELPKLFVASSAIFPTSGHANRLLGHRASGGLTVKGRSLWAGLLLP